MSRSEAAQTMTPKRLDQLVKPGAAEAYKGFEKFGTVRMPDESAPPILTEAVRAALAVWMSELNYAAALAEVGVKPRQRAMLSGLPGTGKTTLAHHVAARLGVPLVIVEISSLVDGHLGATGNNLGQLFGMGRRMKGKVALFFDEIDSVAATRNSDGSSAGNERNNTVIALLQMLDRYDGLVFAATNRPKAIDPAVWRRFEMQIEVELPGEEERFAIIKQYLSPFELPDDSIWALVDALANAAPALIRQVVENIKRDLVLGARSDVDLALTPVLNRIVAALAPADEMPTPPLWSAMDETLAVIGDMAWPPTRTVA